MQIGWSQNVRNEELHTKMQPKRTLLREVIPRKLQLFGHACRMNDSQKVKSVVFDIIYEKNIIVKESHKESWLTISNVGAELAHKI